jgi:hypothetical protein
MTKNDLIPWGNAVHYLKAAALNPQRRGELIARALQEILTFLPAVGTALIWPCQNREVPWKVYYAGSSPESMQHWLAARLRVSAAATLDVLQQDLSSLSDMPIPHLICLKPASRFPAGLWIIWTTVSPLSGDINDSLGQVRQTLEALIEVECSEEHYFSSGSPLSDRALIEALRRGGTHALSVFLGLTRLVANADLTFWGRAYQDVVEITDHLGAKQKGFGCAVPRGRGAGGHIIAYGTPIVVVEDYRTSSYRYPGVSSIIDNEEVRSGIALPVHSPVGRRMSEEVAGVLYVTRRTVKPFSLTERLLVQRLTRLIEPLHPLTRPSSFFLSDLSPVADQKSVWYKVVLRANRQS